MTKVVLPEALVIPLPVGGAGDGGGCDVGGSQCSDAGAVPLDGALLLLFCNFS